MNNQTKKIKKIPIGEQDFESLIHEGYFYLDKTNKLYELLDSGVKYLFLSRPRRFGKSLMLSVLKYLFLGKKELFKGLFIYDKWKFNQYPVLYLSFAGYSKEKDLQTYIKNFCTLFIDDHEVPIDDFQYFDMGLIIKKIKQNTDKPVVVLIDEYDKPILSHLKDIHEAEAIRNFFSSFYASVKDSSAHIKLFFLTGLTKLMKMSIFSVLNNLDDISFEESYSDLIGYTHKEVESNFSDELKDIAKKYYMDYQQFLEKMKYKYNGYNFGNNKDLLYNPWDINNLIKKKKIKNYWADTGIPGAISDYIEENPFEIQDIIDKIRTNELIVKEMDLRVHHLKNLRPEVLFFNSGYLTYKESSNDHEHEYYYLRFPNHETEEVMIDYFLNLSLHKKYHISDWTKVSTILTQGVFKKDRELIKQSIEELIYSILSNTPYDWLSRNPEGWLKTMIGIAFKMKNTYYAAENQSIIGRTDLHIPSHNKIYILEIKVDSKVSNCIQQIENQYESAYEKHFKRIIKVGINWNRNQSKIDVIIKEKEI